MKLLFLLLVGLPLTLFVLGRVGALRGKPPSYLGVTDGNLARPALGKTNSVASQFDGPAESYHSIAAIKPTSGSVESAMTRLRELVKTLPGCDIVRSEPNYLYAQCETKWLRFVDDVEFIAAPEEGVIHVRSASRLGRKDFGVNRARIEHLRAQLSNQP